MFSIHSSGGGGDIGNIGDGGFATAAFLYYPAGFWLDSAGVLFIAEMSGSRVRRVSTSNIITTIAGEHYLCIFP